MPWNRNSQNILALVGGFLNPSWFGQLFKGNTTSPLSQTPTLTPLGTKWSACLYLEFARNFPWQPFSPSSPSTQSVLLIVTWAKLTHTHVRQSGYLSPSSQSCSHHDTCSNNKITVLCISGIYSNTLSGFPKPINTLSQRSPFTAQCEGTQPSAFRFQPFSLIFHFVLWDGIRPGFPQVPGLRSTACQFFHRGPHV